MCEFCEPLNFTKEKSQLEYIGYRMINDMSRSYYRCPHCDQAFYWIDWFAPALHSLEALTINASELMPMLQHDE